MGRVIREIIITFILLLPLFFEGTMVAQSAFDLRYSQAQRFYSEGRYSEAALILEASLDGVGLSENQRATAKQLLDRCRKALYHPEPDPVTVSLTTLPSNAKVSIDGAGSGNTPFVTALKPGRYAIRIDKEGYFPLDTAIVIRADDSRSISLEMSLEPRFATLRLDVKPEEGYSFTLGPEVEVGGHSLDLSSEFHSIEGVDHVNFYQMYQGGLLFVPQGAYVLILSAEGFDKEILQLNLHGGEEKSIAVRLAAKKGTIAFGGNVHADGATVYLDGEELGTLPMDNVAVMAGKHRLSYRKQGMQADKEEYLIDVPEGGVCRAWVSMKKVKAYRIIADDDKASIIVDGKEVGLSPALVNLTEGEHRVMAYKEGSYNGEITISVKPEEQGDDVVRLSLNPTRAVHFYTDRSGKNKESLSLFTKDGHILADRVMLPCEVLIPVNENSFKSIVYTDSPLLRAYKGPIKVKQKESEYQIRTFSKYYLHWVGVDVELPIKSNLKPLFEASLLSFSPLPFAGLSTSVLKVNLDFNESQPVSSVSFLLLNWDLRIGGSISKSMDIGFLGMYTYHPKVFSLPEYGSEWFAGVELASRIPYFNVNVQTGIKVFKEPLFVIRAGITLGGKDAKGNCYLRF